MSEITLMEIIDSFARGNEKKLPLLDDYAGGLLNKFELEKSIQNGPLYFFKLVSSKLRVKLQETLKTYCIEGENPEMYEALRKRVDEIPHYHTSHVKGEIYREEKKTACKTRAITDIEILLVYHFTIERIEKVTETIRQNKRRGEILPAQLEDFYPHFIDGTKDAFTKIHGASSGYSHFSGEGIRF